MPGSKLTTHLVSVDVAKKSFEEVSRLSTGAAIDNETKAYFSKLEKQYGCTITVTGKNNVTVDEIEQVAIKLADELQDVINDAVEAGSENPFPHIQNILDEWQEVYSRLYN